MSTVTLQFDTCNELAMSIMHSIREAGVFKVIEERTTPDYGKEFIAKVEDGRLDMKAGKGKAIKTADLWI